jgi:hypothetical protein
MFLEDHLTQSTINTISLSESCTHWTVERLRKVLMEQGVFCAQISPNTETWFAGVKACVDEGQCTFELFVQHFDARKNPNITWRQALTQAIAVHAS